MRRLKHIKGVTFGNSETNNMTGRDSREENITLKGRPRVTEFENEHKLFETIISNVNNSEKIVLCIRKTNNRYRGRIDCEISRHAHFTIVMCL